MCFSLALRGRLYIKTVKSWRLASSIALSISVILRSKSLISAFMMSIRFFLAASLYRSTSVVVLSITWAGTGNGRTSSTRCLWWCFFFYFSYDLLLERLNLNKNNTSFCASSCPSYPSLGCRSRQPEALQSMIFAPCLSFFVHPNNKWWCVRLIYL